MPTTSARSPSPPASARPRRWPRHIDKTDDYGRIMLKALADRLAEAFAERMHERVRRELWGYAPEEKLSTEELIAEKYRGIRPAPGYPAQPDHTEKAHHLPPARCRGRRPASQLTESFAMWPGAAVSGLYFSHPDSHYFGVGKVERDQVEDYARRKGWSIEEAERWLAPGAQLRSPSWRAARASGVASIRLECASRSAQADARGSGVALARSRAIPADRLGRAACGGKPMLSRLILLALQLDRCLVRRALCRALHPGHGAAGDLRLRRGVRRPRVDRRAGAVAGAARHRHALERHAGLGPRRGADRARPSTRGCRCSCPMPSASC